ncbi:multimerin-1-like [Polypterus senegalus]
MKWIIIFQVFIIYELDGADNNETVIFQTPAIPTMDTRDQMKENQTISLLSATKTPVAADVENLNTSKDGNNTESNTHLKVKSVQFKENQDQQWNLLGGNRYPRKASGRVSKSSFETARGKNWCAYVHTRLSPTAVVDNVESYVSVSTQPCDWNVGGCPVRYQLIRRPTYRVKHKIVTSLEWKCCPGFSGVKCEPKNEEEQRQVVETPNETGSAQKTQLSKSINPEFTENKNDTLYNQEIELLLLKKKMDNISSNMNEVTSKLLSFEEKLNADKTTDIQKDSPEFTLTDIEQLVKEMFQAQVKGLQDNIQEMAAQLFRTVSNLSEELQNSKGTINKLNQTVTFFKKKCQHVDEVINDISKDIMQVKDGMHNMKNDLFSKINNVSKNALDKNKRLKEEFEVEKQKNGLYFEIFNSTVIQIKEIHDQLMLGEDFNKTGAVERNNNLQQESIREPSSVLSETVRKQALAILQLQGQTAEHSMKIGNLSLTSSLQKNLIYTTCETMLFQCKNNFENQMDKLEDHVNAMNKTLCDTILPMDKMFTVMEERISHVSYDLEELKPIIEKKSASKDDANRKCNSEVFVLKKEVDRVSSELKVLSFNFMDFVKIQNELRNISKEKEEQFAKRFETTVVEIEDGINGTMTILNNAIDSVKDNYYTLETEVAALNLQINKTHYESKNFNVNLSFQFTDLYNRMNRLQDKAEMTENILMAMGVLADVMLQDSENNRLPNLTEISLLTRASLSRSENHQQAISSLEETSTKYSQDFKRFRLRLQSVEYKLNSMLENAGSSPKSKKLIKATDLKDMLLKYQELNESINELSGKLHNNTHEILWIQGIALKALNQSQNISLLCDSNANAGQLNITALYNGLKDLLPPTQKATSKFLLANISLYVDEAISRIYQEITKLQKQVKLLSKKQEALLKTNMNITSSLVSRSQRNIEGAVDLVSEETDNCIGSPCQNGGTCINQRKNFVCACRPPFSGVNCTLKLVNENAASTDFSKGSYRYAPMVTFFAAHTYAMTSPGVIRFNHLYVNYGASYAPGSGKFLVPYLGVYVFKYTIKSCSPETSGYLVVDEIDKLAFQSEDTSAACRLITGDAVLELNYGQQVWLRLEKGSIPSYFPPVTTFGGYLLYRT